MNVQCGSELTFIFSANFKYYLANLSMNTLNVAGVWNIILWGIFIEVTYANRPMKQIRSFADF